VFFVYILLSRDPVSMRATEGSQGSNSSWNDSDVEIYVPGGE